MARASYFYLVYTDGRLHRIFTVKHEAIGFIRRGLLDNSDARLKRLRAWMPLDKIEDISHELTPGVSDDRVS